MSKTNSENKCKTLNKHWPYNELVNIKRFSEAAQEII